MKDATKEIFVSKKLILLNKSTEKLMSEIEKIWKKFTSKNLLTKQSLYLFKATDKQAIYIFRINFDKNDENFLGVSRIN